MQNLVFTGRCFCAALGFIGVVASGSVLAQQSPTESPKRAASPAFLQKNIQFTVSNVTLATLLKTIAKQTGANIVVDGEPLKKTIDLTISGTLQDVLDTITDQFDYTWKTRPSGVIVLNKRFQEGKELPQAHFAEIQQVTKDILTALNGLPYDAQGEELYHQGYVAPRWPQMIVTLAHSLNPQQVDALRQGKRLGMADFNPQQRALLEDTVLTNCLSYTRDQWIGLTALLKELPKGYIRADKYPGLADYVFAFVDKDKRPIALSIGIFAPKYTFTSKNP